MRGEQPDQVPWFGDLDYWATALMARGLRKEGFKESPEYIDWHRQLGVGFYLQGHFPFKTIIENCDVKEWKEDQRRYRSVETPHGKIQECWTWLDSSFTEAPTEHLIKTEKDLPAYRFMMENTRYEADYSYAEDRKEQIGEQGALLCYLPKSPFMQMVALDAGIEAIMGIFMDAPDELDETVAAIGASHDKAAQISLDSPAEILMIPENLSSEVVGPLFFEKYMQDYQTRWARKIEAAGKFSCIHLDGTLRGLLREECMVGLSFIEAMTPSPVGDLPVAEWSSYVGATDTIFWGGIPGSYFTDIVDDEEFDRHVLETLSIMREEPRYVLGVADQVPPDGLEARVKRVRELVDKHGRY